MSIASARAKSYITNIYLLNVILLWHVKWRILTFIPHFISNIDVFLPFIKLYNTIVNSLLLFFSHSPMAVDKNCEDDVSVHDWSKMTKVAENVMQSYFISKNVVTRSVKLYLPICSRYYNYIQLFCDRRTKSIIFQKLLQFWLFF